jgi:hypothetical protein
MYSGVARFSTRRSAPLVDGLKLSSLRRGKSVMLAEFQRFPDILSEQEGGLVGWGGCEPRLHQEPYTK